MNDRTVDTRPPEAQRGPLGSRLRIDPRFRQRLIEVKREEGRRRLKALIAATSILVALVMLFGAAKSPLLAVRHVRVVGAVNTPPATIVQAAELLGHPPMIDVNGGRCAGLVRRLPWIDTVTVRRRWPATIEVDVTERVPVATAGAAGATMLVDRTGRILGPPSAGVPASPLPSVTTTPATASPATGPPGSVLDAIYAPGLLVASALTSGLASRVVEVVAAADGSVTLHLAGGASALLGQPGDALAEKLQAVQTILDRVNVTTETIDVTVASAPVLVGGQAK